MSKRTVTVAEFVDLLGGNAKAAKLFGVTEPAVCNWKKAGRFPAWALLPAIKASEERGVTFPPRALKPPRPTGVRAAE